MNADSNAAEVTKCPECGAKLKTILYGLVAGDPGPEYVLGGCSIDTFSPTKACSECDWQGVVPDVEETLSEIEKFLQSLREDLG